MNRHIFYVIAFSGKIGSGKSALSTILAEKLQLNRVSFGDYVRKVASEKKIEHTRINLQNLGESLMNENPYLFCLNVLSQVPNDKPLIVDGIRHQKALEEIRKIIFPSKLSHIHLEVEDKYRVDRIIERSDIYQKEINNIDAHPNERDVNYKLSKIADKVINSSGSLDDTVQELLDWLIKSVL